MALNQIPYTNVHELNLDWILSEIKKFDDYITSIKQIIDQLANYYETVDQLQDEVTALSQEVHTYSDRINALERAEVDIRILINNLELKLIRLISDEENARKAADNELQRQIDLVKQTIADVDALYKYVRAMEKQLREYIRAVVSESEYMLLSYINAHVGRIDAELEEIREMVKHVAINVYNHTAYSYAPDGRIDFDLNNKLIYQQTGNNLTAEEYCKLNLTAAQYAMYRLTAERYLERSFWELHADYVYMPASGSRQNISVAFSDMITAVLGTLSAAQYSALELTAEEYSALDITAREYLNMDADLSIRRLVSWSATGSGLTADEYSHLEINQL